MSILYEKSKAVQLAEAALFTKPLLSSLSVRQFTTDVISKMGATSDGFDSVSENSFKVPSSPLTYTSKHSSRFPILFERASPTWWNPTFDSDVLETQFWRSSFHRLSRRFQFGLLYITLQGFFWSIYFSILQSPSWILFFGLSLSLSAFSLTSLLLTKSQKFYSTHYFKVQFGIIGFLSGISLYGTKVLSGEIPEILLFLFHIEIVLLLYGVFPFPLYLSVLFGLTHSVLYEFFVILSSSGPLEVHDIAVQILLHLCLHSTGIYILITNQIQMRDTFLKVGQSLMVKRQLVLEKSIKEKMIHSVMPPKVADWLLREGHAEDVETEETISESVSLVRKVSSPRSSHTTDLRTMFRPFNMNAMDNVSILFADIVGFTKMSSNKTASQLVGLLNDLFGRFDNLCTLSGCEKISTLGDCYYCVSGCPEPTEDHGRNCVEMGLSMIDAIMKFDNERNESVNMRVGIHTGTVLCGIVGKRRFKFDVWSNDVNLANKMESTGKPGSVHISEKTHVFLKDQYIFTDGPLVEGLKTYFITDRAVINDAFIQPLCHRTKNTENESSHENAAKSLPTLLADKKCSQKASISSTIKNFDESSNRVLTKSSSHGSNKKFIMTESHSSQSKDSKLQTSSFDPFYSDKRDSLFHKQISFSENGKTRSRNKLISSSIHSGRRFSYSLPSLHGQRTLIKGSGVMEACSELFSQASSYIVDKENEESHGSGTRNSDLFMIQCIKEDPDQSLFFTIPPLNPCSFFFRDASIEADYQKNFGLSKGEPAGISTNCLMDFIVSLMLFICLSSSNFLILQISFHWIFIFVTFSLVHLLVFLFLVISPSRKNFSSSSSSSSLRTKMKFIRNILFQRTPRFVLGSFLICIPSISILSNFTCSPPYSMEKYCNVYVISLVSFCTFSTLSFMIKSFPAFLFGALLPLLLLFLCSENEGILSTSELSLHMILFLLLICLLNREFEIGYRLSFHCSYISNRDRKKIQNLKNQADWLLHNIIPSHVSDSLKKSAKYSENHFSVGIIFASIVNFNELYDESYLGGVEYLRVLNELISDFDELLDRSEFQNVEKIKTIGSTFMAASGMNPNTLQKNTHKYQHIYELMEFALQLEGSVSEFNKSLIEFDLILRVGFHFGDVTSGVIGTTKLYFDIWGDAVNIASRMESTGLDAKIQVSKTAMEVLSEWYTFTERGSIYVKGKDNMTTYILLGKKNNNES